ncbi:MAG: MltA domain-containing protein [Alphaproteobacteria bacterium]|nr:MltA domain-containing protein [Alphaproteobacteria bacterium]MCB9927942.1 MltA domain-containing protein [Alphaproteobacteria bacterium]
MKHPETHGAGRLACRFARPLLGAALLLLAACAPSDRPLPRQPAVQPAPASPHALSSLPGWGRDTNLSQWLQAWKRSCARRPWQGRPGVVDAAAWQAVCTAAEKRRHVDSAWIARHFRVGRMEESALVTGYFEPSLTGARVRSPAFPVPLYRPPADPALAGLDRTAIDRGSLAGRGLELAWLADPVDAFFLHIQGSGRIVFPDGSAARVGFAGANGRPYHAIGRDLVADGEISREAVSMQSIAAWLRAHPVEAPAMMQRNPRYIYFRWIDGDGPVGAGGMALTPERSLAVDPTRIAYGLPVWLDVEGPGGPDDSRLQTLTVAQDTGSAIRGAGRADLFWGAGQRAADLAGRMQSRGRLYVLLPRRAAP